MLRRLQVWISPGCGLPGLPAVLYIGSAATPTLSGYFVEDGYTILTVKSPPVRLFPPDPAGNGGTARVYDCLIPRGSGVAVPSSMGGYGRL